MTKIHGIDTEDYVIGVWEDGTVEFDFDGFQEAIANSAECSTLNCTNRVAGVGICFSCFMASILGNKVWLDSRKGYVRMDKKMRYY